MMLTAERLRELFIYQPDTGLLLRKTARGNRSAGSAAGCEHGDGYLSTTVDGRKCYVHVLIWAMQTGAFPLHQIDHRDGVRSNNKWLNIRPSTPSLNKQNMRRARSDSRIGLLGVGKAGRRFRASIGVNGKYKHLGVFDTPEQAHRAYITAKRKLHPGNTL